MRIHIIDAPRRLVTPRQEEIYRLTKGYWFPVVLAAPMLRDQGIDVSFHGEFSDAALDCDLALVSSRHHDQTFGTEHDVLARAMSVARLAQRGAAIGWFDQRDSSGTTQFEVLPFVQTYFKQCLLKDRALYRKPLYGGRIFTDHFHRLSGVIDTLDPASAHNQEDGFTPLDAEFAHKLSVGWNIGYTFRGLFASTSEERRWIEQAANGLLAPVPQLGAPNGHRPLAMAAMMSTTGYCRQTIVHQRQMALSKLRLSPLAGMDTELASPYRYAELLRQSKTALSCFGNGEICYREHEAWQSGAAVVMPNMDHLETYPDSYVNGETYYAIDWDLTALQEAVDRLLGDDDLRLSLAQRGQEHRSALFSRAGIEAFARRFVDMVCRPNLGAMAVHASS